WRPGRARRPAVLLGTGGRWRRRRRAGDRDPARGVRAGAGPPRDADARRHRHGAPGRLTGERAPRPNGDPGVTMAPWTRFGDRAQDRNIGAGLLSRQPDATPPEGSSFAMFDNAQMLELIERALDSNPFCQVCSAPTTIEDDH